MRLRSGITALLTLSTAIAAPAAAPGLASLFGSSMVLPAGRPIPLSGHADPGDRVEVRFGSVVVEATADSRGCWHAELPAMDGRVLAMLPDGGSLELDDILVAEVWVSAGPVRTLLGQGLPGSKQKPPPAPIHRHR